MANVKLTKDGEAMEVPSVDAGGWMNDGWEIEKDGLSSEVLKFFEGEIDYKAELAKANAKIEELEAKLAKAKAK